MKNPSSRKHTWPRFAGLLLLLAIGLLIPRLALAQTLPPPPPIEQRWQLALQNRAEGGSPVSPPSATQNGFFPWARLAFQSYRDGNWEIYAGSDDGTNLVRLTDDPASDMQPRINRGATRLVFSSNRDGDYEIFSINLDGSALTRLTDNSTDDVAPVWSPDGTKILFQAYRDGQSEIYVMNADGSAPARLTAAPDYDGQPDWSPDGQKIAFVSRRTGGYRIWVMNADGSNPIQLSAQSYSAHPKWSPDGSRIGYDADVDGDGWQDVMVMNADGSNPWMLVGRSQNNDFWMGSWSPDGVYLAYTAIHYVFYQNNWYWTDARVVVNHTNGSYIGPMTSGNLEWNPDWQSADVLPPVSHFIPLPSQSPGPFFLSWTGTDQGIAGVKGYDVEFSEDPNGAWTPLLAQYPATIIGFPGISGHTYYFRIRARDNAGNLEAWRAGYQAVTTVEALPPIITTINVPPFDRGASTVIWQGTDPGGSGIKSYDAQYRVGSSTQWNNLVTGALITDIKVYGRAGETFHYRVRATDTAQNVGPWYGDNEKTQTTFYAWTIFGLVHDNSGAPVRNAQILSSPALLSNLASYPKGDYIGYGNQSAVPFSMTWSKDGYGSLPNTDFKPDVDARLDVTLPPLDNRVLSGTFESDNSLPGDWQTSGSLPAGISHSQPHTGTSAALLGVPYWGDLEVPATAVAVYYGSKGTQTRTVVDSLGTVHILWIENSANDTGRRLQYSSKAPGGSWSPPLDISGRGGVGDMPDVAVDSHDNLHVVWASNGTRYTTRPSGGAWSVPIMISYMTLWNPAIAVGLDGNVHVVGGSNNGLGYIVGSAGHWAVVSFATTGGNYPKIKVDRAGTVHLLWKSYVTSTQYSVNYANKPAGGAWSAGEIVSSGPSDYMTLDVGLAEDDTLHAVWETTGTQAQIEYRSKTPGSAWSAPVLFNAGSTVNDLKVAATPQKVTIVFAGVSLSSNDVYGYLEKRAGSNWSDAMAFPSSRVKAMYSASLAVGPDGALHLAWFEWVYRNYGTPNPSGEIHYLKGSPFKQTGEARLSQTLTIPEGAAHTTLAFYYQLGSGSASNQTGFNVQVQTPAGATNLLTTQADTLLGWTFQSFDVSAWHGQTVTLVFRVNQAAGYLQPWALIDDVSLGSTYPDVWGNMATPRAYAGGEVTYPLSCGNLGSVAASQVQMEVTLPPDVTFVSADPAPASLSPRLTWETGSLAPKSEGCAVNLTVKIAFPLSASNRLTAQIKVSTSSTEFELENNTLTVSLPINYSFRLPVLSK